jgi:hypothetical protein
MTPATVEKTRIGDSMPDYIDHLARMDACPDALAWLRTENHPTLNAAWAACPRGDWMLWLAGRCTTPGSAEHRAVVAAAADCAAEVLGYIPPGEERPRFAIETARRWVRGEATIEECYTAHLDAAAAAGDPATVAARAAAAAAAAAVYTPRAAYTATAHEAAFAALVRRHLPNPPTK